MKTDQSPPADHTIPAQYTSPELINRAAAVLFGTCCGLLLVVGYLLLVVASDRPAPDPLDDPVVRQEVINELVQKSGGIWDSCLDADVGRVLMPWLRERGFKGAPISSNEFGMRERPYQWRKPPGVVRVVLLGDSYVFGYGAEQDHRLGVHLEQHLLQGATQEVAGIEVLHLAVSSWNIIAECAYLRRQLSQLQPDLVIHQIAKNDLADQTGVRGFGAMSQFSPQVRQRANGIVLLTTPRGLWPRPVQNHLLDALDWESRSRYARAAAEIERLAAALDEIGARYVFLALFTPYLREARELLAANLAEDQQAYLPSSFEQQTDLWNSRKDRHWNRLGHERVAEILYGLIVERDLLPQLAPRPWEKANRAYAEVLGEGLREATSEEDRKRRKPGKHISYKLVIPPSHANDAAQVYSGINARGNVAPYASFVLATAGGRTLSLRGQILDLPELQQGTTHVFVDELEVGSLDLGSQGSLPASFMLPAAVAQRPYVAVRLVSDDYVYGYLRTGMCVAFRLERAAIR